MRVCGGHKDHPGGPSAGLEPEHLLPGEYFVPPCPRRTHSPPRQRPLQAGNASPGILHAAGQRGGQHLLHWSSAVPGLLLLSSEGREGGGRRRRRRRRVAGDATSHVISEASCVPATSAAATSYWLWPQLLPEEEEPPCVPQKPGASAPSWQR